MPSSSVSQPRWWLEVPELFGEEAQPAWKPPRADHPEDLVNLRAAMIQHACVVTMSGQAKLQGLSWRQVAAQLHTVSYEQFLRVVRGEAQLSLRLLSDLSDVFGPVLVYSDDVRMVFRTEWPTFESD